MSRCIARRKDFERCANNAEIGSFFCRRHRWWWVITLFGMVVVVTTLGANIAQMFGVTFPNPFLISPNISIQEISTPLYSSNSIRLVPIGDQNIVVKLGDQSLSPGSTIPLNETITVIFKILNNGTSPVTIKALVIGSRGPGVNCENPNVEKWSAPDNPFPTPRNITIQPGEEYEYQGSRAFYLPGKYFLEPIIQGPNDNWGGIQPFSCISIIVGGTQSVQTQTVLIPTSALTQVSNLYTLEAPPSTSSFQYEGWIVCWHGSDNYEITIAFPQLNALEGIELDMPLKRPWDNQTQDVANDSLKMCLVDGVWYGYITPSPPWFYSASYLLLEPEKNEILLCSDTPRCTGERWTMSQGDPPPPEVQNLLQPVVGNEVQILDYIASITLP